MFDNKFLLCDNQLRVNAGSLKTKGEQYESFRI